MLQRSVGAKSVLSPGDRRTVTSVARGSPGRRIPPPSTGRNTPRVNHRVKPGG